jgi:OmcA/MtrC family decaheme c-type cytochrome
VGAHIVPRFSTQLKGVVLDIVAVDGAAPGKSPTVTFTIKDNSGAAIPISSMARVNLVLAGPNTDYSFYVSEDARKASGPGDGRYFWTFAKTIPADASGSWSVGIEARRDATLNVGTVAAQTIREVGRNKVFYFSVDGSPVQPRRTVVALANCNNCHFSLSLHGDNRNQIEQCVLCHNPSMTASGTSIDFKVMVHRIHNGKNATRPYKVGNSSFAEVGYPGVLANCSDCHVNGSEQLPLDKGQSAVTETTGYLNPMSPATAACTGCHDTKSAAAHASLAVNSVGEACGVCHGANSEQSVNKVHAQ